MLQLTKHSPRTGFIEGKFRHRVCNAHTHTQKGLKKNPLHRSRALSSSQLFCNHPPFLPNPIHLHQSCPNPPPSALGFALGSFPLSAHCKCYQGLQHTQNAPYHSSAKPHWLSSYGVKPGMPFKQQRCTAPLHCIAHPNAVQKNKWDINTLFPSEPP